MHKTAPGVASAEHQVAATRQRCSPQLHQLV